MTNRGAMIRTLSRERRPRRARRVHVSHAKLRPSRSTDASDDGAALADEGLYRAMAVGISLDGGSSTEHDAILYLR